LNLNVHCYDQLAPYYHLLFEDWEASIERQAAVLGPILERECGPANRTRVLDCACGVGTQALGLAGRGFRVSGCDLSPAAIERARLEASRRGLDIPFSAASMLDLSGQGESPFDAVICMDNALPHLANRGELVQAAVQVRARLRVNGRFVASIRDYDLLTIEKPAVQGPNFFSDDGHRRIVFQVWDWLDDRRYVFHVYITRKVEGEWQTFHTAGAYRAVLKDELTAALGEAGFANVRWLLPGESRFYQPIVLASAA